VAAALSLSLFLGGPDDGYVRANYRDAGDARRPRVSKRNRSNAKLASVRRWNVRLIALVAVVFDARGGRLIEARRRRLHLDRLLVRRAFGLTLGFSET